MNLCPICDRELINGPSIEDHHLTPRTFGGTETVTIHKICHRKLHHTFSERQMLQHWHTIERIREHPEIQNFVAWLKNKHPEFDAPNRDSAERKRRRRR